MDNTKKIVVLGAGYGGILTAKKLAKKFKNDNSVEITLIDKNSYHTMLTELHEVSAGRVPEDSIRIDLKKVFAGRKVNVVLDEITEMDFKNQVLKSNKNSYKYDHLVIGTGSKPTYWGVPGAEENSFPLWSYEDAVNLKEHILNMFRRAMVEPDAEKRKALLTFVVVGSGFTGIEMVGELGEYKDRLCADFHIDPNEVKLYAVDGAPKILPIFPDNLINKTVKRLEKLGVEIITSSPTSEIGKDYAILKGGRKIPTHTVIWAAGVEGSDTVGNTELKQEGRKRIVTNDKLQSLDYQNVYVVGDNIFYIPEGEQRPVPQMVENAEHSSGLIAHNLATDITGGEKKSYKPVFHGAMVCVGGKYGVAQIGTPGKMYEFSGFIAMFVKHFINLVYFFQVAGFNKCWSYLMLEFFHVKDNRSFVGGLLSKATPVFWLVPLRLFVGYKWLTEGLVKLPKIMEDPSNIFLIPAAPNAAATSGASQAAEAAAETVATVTALPVPDFIANMVKWSMDMFFYTPDGSGFTGLAQVFQTGMVFAEIVVGLLLIAGLFSPIAAIVSILMGIMIWSSGMAPTEMLWFIFSAVALIGWSGSVLGLDYYVLPLIKKWWNKTGFAKKTYLYVD
jgi:NADH:ubiquinone reductase (H+-translocating)